MVFVPRKTSDLDNPTVNWQAVCFQSAIAVGDGVRFVSPREMKAGVTISCAAPRCAKTACIKTAALVEASAFSYALHCEPKSGPGSKPMVRSAHFSSDRGLVVPVREKLVYQCIARSTVAARNTVAFSLTPPRPVSIWPNLEVAFFTFEGLPQATSSLFDPKRQLCTSAGLLRYGRSEGSPDRGGCLAEHTSVCVRTRFKFFSQLMAPHLGLLYTRLHFQ